MVHEKSLLTGVACQQTFFVKNTGIKIFKMLNI